MLKYLRQDKEKTYRFLLFKLILKKLLTGPNTPKSMVMQDKKIHMKKYLLSKKMKKSLFTIIM